MKKGLIIVGALVLWVALVMSCRGGDVQFRFQNPQAAGLTNRPMKLFPTGGPFTNGAGVIVTRDLVSGITDTNGSLILSNVYGWTYRSEIQGTFTTTTNYFNFPVTNGLIQAADYSGTATNGQLTYTQSQIDGSFAHRAGDTFSGGVTNNSAAGFVGNGAGLTALNGSQVTSGTVAAARGGAGAVNGIMKADGAGTVGAAAAGADYLAPGGSGASLTALNANQLTSGTVPDARFPATLPAASGANLTSLNGSQVTSGTIAAARGGAGAVNGILKANGSGTVSAATAGTDYLTTSQVPLQAFTTNSSVAVPTASVLNSNVTYNASRFSGIGRLYRNPNNPCLTQGAGGSWKAFAVRDACCWYARGGYHMLYTGNKLGVSPYSPKIGYATSPDGLTWTDQSVSGALLDKVGSGAWNSGGVFSPSVYYDAATDELWVFVSGIITDDSAYFTGPIATGLLKASAAADWTQTSSFVYQNSGSPIITADTGQGSYSTSHPIKLADGTFVIFYSTFTSSTWTVKRATAATLSGAWTKQGIAFQSQAEEPAVIQMPNGSLLAISEGGVESGYGNPIWWTSDSTGATGWRQGGKIMGNGTNAWEVGRIGSVDLTQAPDGRYLMAYCADNGTSLAERIGTAFVSIEPEHTALYELDIAQANQVHVGTNTTPANYYFFTNALIIDQGGTLQMNQSRGVTPGTTALWDPVLLPGNVSIGVGDTDGSFTFGDVASASHFVGAYRGAANDLKLYGLGGVFLMNGPGAFRINGANGSQTNVFGADGNGNSIAYGPLIGNTTLAIAGTAYFAGATTYSNSLTVDAAHTLTANSTTQTAGDNSTRLATTAYVDTGGGWTISKVSGSDATTTGQTLVDVTGLTFAAAAGTRYEVEAVLECTTSAVATGTEYGIQYSGTGSPTVQATITGSLTTTTAGTSIINALNTADATAFLTTSAQTGIIIIKGFVVSGSGAGNITVRHLKVTSGTSTVKIGSILKVRPA